MSLLSPAAVDLLAQVVEVSADAIYTEDVDGRVMSWNAAAQRLYGSAPSDAVGRRSADLVAPGSAAALADVRRRALAGERVERFDTQVLAADGRVLDVSLTASPLRDATGAVVGVATSVQDVGDRIGLARELAEASALLEEQNAALSRSNRDLQQFAYVASHDLSEPLRVMTGYVQLLERRYGEVLDENGRRWIGYVVDGAERMRRLIDDLLEFSRFLRSDLSTDVLDLTALAEAAAAGVRAGAPDGSRVEVQPLPGVLADRSGVEMVLANVLANAVKFSRPGEPAHVVVHAEQHGDRVHLLVDDAGIGVPDQYRERVFRMFQRLHSRDEYEGTGIGLALVQQVAELHGGSAAVEDSPLGGARLRVVLPAAGTGTA